MIAKIKDEGPSYTEENIQTYISIYNDWYMKQHPDFKMRKDRAVEKVEKARTHPIDGASLEEALSKLTPGKKETLAEKINKYDKIPVYFLQEQSNIQSDAFDANGKALNKEEWFKEFSDEQKNDIYDFLVAEMNYLFKTDKFVRDEDYPGKKYDFSGDGIQMYVKLQLYGRYNVSDLNSQNVYDITYKLNHQMTFREVNKKGKFKNVGKYWGAEKCKKTNPGRVYGLTMLEGLIDPSCPIDGFKAMVKNTGAEWILKQFPLD